ncbi:hypothetical protein CW732_18510 [Olleya sp. Bg11-27]|nr:hypothetical protein CW732_18510 [Olleya sp. Bg11-27]
MKFSKTIIKYLVISAVMLLLTFVFRRMKWINSDALFYSSIQIIVFIGVILLVFKLISTLKE